MGYLLKSVIITMMTAILTSGQLRHRKIFIYREIGREPYSQECRNDTLTGTRRLVAIHVVDNSPFTEPCYCVLFNTEDKNFAQVVNIKHQSHTSLDNTWTQVNRIYAEEWEHFGYGGLYLQIQQQQVVFFLQNTNITTNVAVAIEVGEAPRFISFLT